METKKDMKWLYKYYPYAWEKFPQELVNRFNMSIALLPVEFAFYDNGELYCFPTGNVHPINYFEYVWTGDRWESV